MPFYSLLWMMGGATRSLTKTSVIAIYLGWRLLPFWLCALGAIIFREHASHAVLQGFLWGTAGFLILRLKRQAHDRAAQKLRGLGRVDEVPDPEADRGDLHEAEEACGGLVVAGGDASGVLEAVEAPLDPVAQGVDVAVDALADLAASAGRNDGHAAAIFHVLADRVGVIAAVGQQDACGRPVRLHQGSIAAVVGDLAAGDLGRYGQAHAVRAEVDLGREATSRTAKTLILNPPLAPAAQ